MSVTDANGSDDAEPAPVSARRVMATVLLGAVAVLVIVGVTGSVAARRLAERESVNDAAKGATLIADAVVMPALANGLPRGDSTAFEAMDDAVRAHVLGDSIVRVKIWTSSGSIVYSDEPRLVGRTYRLDAEERGVFVNPQTRAEVSDLDSPENVYERGRGKLLEVYRPVWTPDGQPLLFEIYAPYGGVTARSGQIWRGFAGITVTSLMALVVLLVPVVWRLLQRLRRAQEQREALLTRAVDASTDERRRIAGTLHDGVVQELAATSYAVTGAAARAESVGQPALAAQLREAASSVRSAIRGMRSLLVDIYPPNLATAGLAVALEDLTTSLRSRQTTVVLDVDLDSVDGLTSEQERLVYRVAHELLLNVRRHSLAANVWVTLRRDRDTVVLEVQDDGVGFDAPEMLRHPPDGHFGIRVLGDVTRDAGADLRVGSAPGRGSLWELRVHRHGWVQDATARTAVDEDA